MKKIYKISLVVILFGMLSLKSHAQQTALAYLQSFETNKSEYIGKSFSYLMNKITLIEPSTVYSGGCMSNIYMVKETDFYFSPPYKGFKGDRRIYITIIWQTPIPTKDVDENEEREGANRVKYTEAKKKFYGNRIIKNIEVIEE